jgi:hypothetical protein
MVKRKALAKGGQFCSFEFREIQNTASFELINTIKTNWKFCNCKIFAKLKKYSQNDFCLKMYIFSLQMYVFRFKTYILALKCTFLELKCTFLALKSAFLALKSAFLCSFMH